MMLLGSSIAHWRVKDLMSALSSDQVSPGSNSAVAIALALAASCASKSILMSLKVHPERNHLHGALESLAEITRRALASADCASEVFDDFVRSRDSVTSERLDSAGGHLDHLIALLGSTLDEVQQQGPELSACARVEAAPASPAVVGREGLKELATARALGEAVRRVRLTELSTRR